ncbi:hypothetical protein N6H18_08550 [Reichenbachiella agarivorans]|uniref:Hpt domain-containing protein n=1 Tax=Reichenbachiella agarivorans TaxID=2979464 RepID=A0ABY6CUI4_9BACT|nr:hypothetical protein [Reichenbachiella agarivorans]UXP33994.1 hypothetical protein N6H18_08550 [Reichenbachiella agarivorans]
MANRTQLVILDHEGSYIDSCQTLKNVSGFEGSIFMNSFIINKYKEQILNLSEGQEIECFCISDPFFRQDLICDYQIRKVRIEGQIQLHWLIHDRTQSYMRGNEREMNEVEVREENNELRQLVRKLEQEKYINLAVYGKLYHEMKAPISGLKFLSTSISRYLEPELKKRFQLSCGIISGYLEHAVNQLGNTELKETNSPFKIDQIIAAVEDTFLGEKDVHLLFDKEFESSIVIGNKYKLYTGIVRLLSIINDSRPDGRVRIVFSYDMATHSLLLTFRPNLLPDAQHRVVLKYLEVRGVLDLKVEMGTLVMMCPVDDIKIIKTIPVQKKTNSEVREITQAHFPYLYQITNQDDDMVRDIIEGVLDVVPFELEKMLQQYEERDFNALARTTHKVKPNFENLEQKQFMSRIFEIEAAALNKDDSYLKQHLESFVREASARIDELKGIYT